MKLWNILSESLKTQNGVDTLTRYFWTNGRLNPAEERERIHKKDAKKHLQLAFHSLSVSFSLRPVANKAYYQLFLFCARNSLKMA